MGAIDYWCNIYTAEGLKKTFQDPAEVADVMRWWGLDKKVVGRTTPEFVAYMDAAGMDAVLVPAAKMASYSTRELLWDVSEEEVAALAEDAPGRVYGLVGINPWEGMSGVKRLDRWVREGPFVGAHLHPYGYGLELNHRRYYPFYAKCAELGVPVVAQVGHSAERMPSAAGRPILIDDVALDFPELTFIAAHTGWPWVEELIALAWKHSNVYIGTSAHHPRYWDPAIVQFANTRGKGKVLFGTDYPVMDHGEAVAAIHKIEMRDPARELVLGGAARTVFRLDDAPVL